MSRRPARPKGLGLVLALILTACTPSVPTPEPVTPPASPGPGSATDCTADADRLTVGDIDGDGVADPVVATRDEQRGGVLDVHNSRAGEQVVGEDDLGRGGPSSLGYLAQVANVNRDGCSDVVSLAAGAIYLIPGSDSGLVPGLATRLERPSSLKEEDNWGQAIAVLTHPAVLAVGVAALESPHHGGAVMLYPLASDGTPGEPTVIDQDTPGVAGIGESGDAFGSSLVAAGPLLAIGASGEKIAGRQHAGSVTLLRFNGSGLVFSALRITEGDVDPLAARTAVDSFGDVLDVRDNYLAVGMPSAVIGGVQAGMVHVIELSGDPTPRVKEVHNLHQNSPGIPGKNEKFDHWGGAVALAANVGCTPLSVAVGATGERFGELRTGAVTLVGIGRACGDQWEPGSGSFNAGFCRFFGRSLSVLGSGTSRQSPDVVVVGDPFARVDGELQTGYVAAVRTIGEGKWASSAVEPFSGYREYTNYGGTIGNPRHG